MAQDRTWCSCLLDCLGYFGLEVILIAFMGCLYVAWVLCFCLVVFFSISVRRGK